MKLATCVLALGSLLSAWGGTASAKAPKEAWTVSRVSDPITGVSRCVVAAPDQFGKFKYTRLGYLYPIVENNSKLGLLVGVSSGGPYRMPTGDIQWKVDGNPFRTLRASDNPADNSSLPVNMTPYKTGNVQIDAMAAQQMAQASRMVAAATSTSTVASGPAAIELLREMLGGSALIFRQAAAAAQYGLPGSQTYAVGQITSEGLRPIPLDASFRRGLSECGISLPAPQS